MIIRLQLLFKKIESLILSLELLKLNTITILAVGLSTINSFNNTLASAAFNAWALLLHAITQTTCLACRKPETGEDQQHGVARASG